jgi:hypothetical protein
MPGQLQNRGPMAQPIQQQLSMQQQRGAKRNSTSPGEEVRYLYLFFFISHPIYLLGLLAPDAAPKRTVPPGA